MKALRLLMVFAALALVVPGWALAQGAGAAPVSAQALVLPQGQELSEEELDSTEGKGGLTAVTGLLMMGDGIKKMYDSAKSRDWIDFALGAGEYIVGKATFLFGVVSGPASP